MAVSQDRRRATRTPRTGKSAVYQLALALLAPPVRWWGRLQVEGLEQVPLTGPMLLVANHDSAWDPLIIGVAAGPRRQISAMARSSLWRPLALGWVMDRMAQIPVERGSGSGGAVEAAVAVLRSGGCVGLFPEGYVSRGRRLRVHSGAGRIAIAVPEAVLVCASITGAVGMSRFPRRPRLRIVFFTPTSGPPRPGESGYEVASRIVGEIRTLSPPAA